MNMFSLLLAVTLWLPLLFAAPPAVLSADLRIDNIPLSQLRSRLATFGIPEPVRSQIIREETERRKHPASVPERTGVEPSAELFWIPTMCAQGQGCAFAWKCIGLCSSHWMVEEDGFVPYATGWTPLLSCVPGILCTVLSRMPATPSVDVIAFQPYASAIPPIPLSWDCI